MTQATPIQPGTPQDDSPPDSRVMWLRRALGFCSTLAIVLYLVIALARINHPFELEWMEGGTLVKVGRVLAGEKIYVRPSPEFAPFFYTPLYYYVAALASKCLGGGFMPLRLVSIVCSLGCLGLIATMAWHRSRSWHSGLVAAGLFAAAYKMTGLWYDLGRVDSLFLLLLLGAIHSMLAGRGLPTAVLAGMLTAASYFTKQTALPVAFWLLVLEILRNPRRAAAFGASAGILIVAVSLWLDSVHEGWYSYVTRRLMLNQSYLISSVWLFWLRDMLPQLPVCFALVWLLLRRAIREGRRLDAWTLVLLGGGMIGSAWLSRINIGGYRNVLIPAVAFLSVVTGWALPQGAGVVAQSSPTGGLVRGPIFLYSALLLQFALFTFDLPTRSWSNPLEWIPTRADRAAGEAFIKDLRRIEGDVLLSNHPYLLVMAGKKPCAHTAGVDDVQRGDDGRVQPGLTDEIRRRIRSGQYAAVILEREWLFRRDTERHYFRERPVFERPDVFWPVTGWRTRPEEIWRPAPQGDPPAGTREPVAK